MKEDPSGSVIRNRSQAPRAAAVKSLGAARVPKNQLYRGHAFAMTAATLALATTRLRAIGSAPPFSRFPARWPDHDARRARPGCFHAFQASRAARTIATQPNAAAGKMIRAEITAMADIGVSICSMSDWLRRTISGRVVAAQAGALGAIIRPGRGPYQRRWICCRHDPARWFWADAGHSATGRHR